MLRIMVKNPDGTLAKALTKEQFAVVHDYVVGQMNKMAAIKDSVILAKLQEAGLPVDFTVDAEPAKKSKRRTRI